MRKRTILLSILGVLAVVFLTAVFFYYKYVAAPPLKTNALELYTLEGEKASLDTYKGKKLFINFFATWCGPCMAEMPMIKDAQALLADENFVFVCISDDAVERLTAYKQRTGFPVLILRSNINLPDMGIHSIPISYLLNEQGETVFEKTGSFEGSAEELANTLRGALD